MSQIQFRPPPFHSFLENKISTCPDAGFGKIWNVSFSKILVATETSGNLAKPKRLVHHKFSYLIIVTSPFLNTSNFPAAAQPIPCFHEP